MKTTSNHNEPTEVSHLVPGPDEPFRMSFAELAIELSITQTGSPRSIVMEREIKRRLTEEQSHSRRCRVAMGMGMGVGGLIALASFTLGAFVRDLPPHDHAQRPAAAQKMELFQSPPRDLRRN